MYKSDLEIARESKMDKIIDVAKRLGIDEENLELYGNYKAKVNAVIDEKKISQSKLILVTAINPTKAGEGKSTTTIGLGDGLSRLGENVAIAIREPSFGPTLGVKGGACGGGYAQVVPMEDINLHFTGDLHAITCANNTISAMLDNSIFQGNPLNIDPNNITFKRCVDLNDRTLRVIRIGIGDKNGVERTDGFNITVASEIMAVLTLAADLEDLRSRVDRIVVGFTYDKKPVTVKDLGCTGCIVMILKDAIKPNLVQTIENTPAFVHGGPFANIAHGCNSLIATKTAMNYADIVVTEAGFGADLGGEKFLDIKCVQGDLKPDLVVVVATIRALKMHGGIEYDNLKEENVQAMLSGVCNLEKHIDTVKAFNLPFVVCINKFVTDTDKEVETLMDYFAKNEIPFALSEVWEHGGKGGEELAKVCVEILKENKENKFSPIYDKKDSLEEKMTKIAQTVYGASGVVLTDFAKEQLRFINEQGWSELGVCMAKTPNSLSDDPKRLGAPKDFVITVRELRPSIGAGFIVALTGKVLTMPGLPKHPIGLDLDVVNGEIIGLF